MSGDTPISTTRIALLSILSALCLGIQLLPRPMNLEFTSVIAFTTGMVFGSVFGGSLGAAVMFVNGFLSPYGAAGVVLPFQIVGMTLVGIVGGLYARTANGRFSAVGFFEVAVLGAFLTFIYDVVTNIGTAFYLDLPFNEAIVAALISGIPASIIHIAWNTSLFGTVTVPLVNTMKKMIVGR